MSLVSMSSRDVPDGGTQSRYRVAGPAGTGAVHSCRIPATAARAVTRPPPTSIS
jgi:hypothetical protein